MIGFLEFKTSQNLLKTIMNEIQEPYHNRNLKTVAYDLNPHTHAFLHLAWYGFGNRSESINLQKSVASQLWHIAYRWPQTQTLKVRTQRPCFGLTEKFCVETFLKPHRLHNVK